MSKYKKGDKVRCVKPTLAIGVNIGDIYTINNPEIHNFGKGWHVTLEEVISTPNEEVLELYEENVVKQTENQTPFEKKGWTENSIFKVINDCGSCFEVGDLVVIDSEHDDYNARFKFVSEYGQYRKPYRNCLTFEGLEYVGELGALEKQVKESKKLEIKAQIEALQEQLKTLD